MYGKRLICRRCNSKIANAWNKKYKRRFLANKLRQRGLSEADAWKWSGILRNPQTHCALCGIPLWKLLMMTAFRAGGVTCNQRMSLDHIHPGINDGHYRALCFSCNSLRGDDETADAGVLRKMRKWYQSFRSLGRLWWLHKTYNPVTRCGEGGKKERTPRMEQKIDDLHAGGDDE